MLLMFFFVIPSLTLAQSNDSALNQSPILGNYHDYSVTAKSSGTLVVNARIVLSNPTDEDRSTYRFVKPEGLKGELVVFQQVLGRICDKIDYGYSGKDSNYKCLAYRDPDYRYDNYPTYSSNNLNEKTTYHRVSVEEKEGMLVFNLPIKVESYKDSAVIFSYYLSGQVKNGFLGRKYLEFKSLGDEGVAKEINVAVNADSDVYKKSQKSSVQDTSLDYGISAISSFSVGSPALNSASHNIGKYSNWMVKTGEDILPGENFIVKGVYSTSWIGLYWSHLLISIAVLISLILLVRWLLKKNARAVESQSTSNPNPSFKEAANLRNFLSAFGVSFGIVLSYVAIISLGEFLAGHIGYKYYSFVALGGAALSLVATAVAIGYLVYRWIKFGLNSAIVVIISYILTIAIGIVALAIYVSLNGASYYGGVI